MASIYFFLYLGPFFLLLFYISIFIVVCLLFKDKRAITAYMLVGLSVITQIDSFIIFNWEAKVAIQLIFPISLLLLLLVAGFQIMNWLFEDGFEL
jgi:hypothetical protein